MATVLMVLGGAVSVVGGLMMLPIIWAEGMMWFLACIFISPASIVFAVLHWEKCQKSVIIQVAGTAVFFLGYMIAPAETKATLKAYASGTTPPPAAAAAAPAPAPKPVAAPVAAAPAPAPAPPPEDTRSPVDRMRGECASELSILCSGPSGGKAQLACLREHEDSVTDRCKKALPDAL